MLRKTSQLGRCPAGTQGPLPGVFENGLGPICTHPRVRMAWIKELLSCWAVSVWVSFIYVQGRPPTARTVHEQHRWPIMNPGGRLSLILKSGRSAVRPRP